MVDLALAQGRKGVALEFVENMFRAAPEGQIGDEAIAGDAVILADALCQFDRQGGRDRDGAPGLEIAMRDLHRAVRVEHPTHDIAGIEAAHTVDNARDFRRMGADRLVRQRGEIEPNRERKAEDCQDHAG